MGRIVLSEALGAPHSTKASRRRELSQKPAEVLQAELALPTFAAPQERRARRLALRRAVRSWHRRRARAAAPSRRTPGSVYKHTVLKSADGQLAADRAQWPSISREYCICKYSDATELRVVQDLRVEAWLEATEPATLEPEVEFSVDLLYLARARLKRLSAPGVDMVSAEMVVSLPPKAIAVAHHLFSLRFVGGRRRAGG